MCNENIIGRWLWKSGTNKNNYLIPWEIQSVNTSPDNFILEKDKTFILNGEIIINSQNNNNIINKKIVGKNGDGNNIIGLSIIEFIMLKGQSKISVLFYGGKGTGFIGIKKL